MTKFSCVMLVSRCNELFFNSIKSVHRQEPDSFKAYIDSHALGDKTDIVCSIVEKYGGEPIIQHYNPEEKDHHVDMVHTHHRAFLEAEHPIIVQIDDDDELLGTRREIIDEYWGDDVGIIYGDVLTLQDGRAPRIRKSKQIDSHLEVSNIKGSSRIINREAFKHIHDKLDHGYWLDFKIYYWIMRLGYKAVYVPQLFSVHNMNTDINPERVHARQTGWQYELELLEKQSL